MFDSTLIVKFENALGLFGSYYFRSVFGDFWLLKNGGWHKFVEAILNLFMELFAPNLTNLVNLDVKQMEILYKTWFLYQVNSILQRRVKKEKALWVSFLDFDSVTRLVLKSPFGRLKVSQMWRLFLALISCKHTFCVKCYNK